MKHRKEKTRRMEEQRWLIDKVIETSGVDFSWAPTGNALSILGYDAYPDVMSIRARVKKYADISREFERVASRREAVARKAEGEGHPMTARENYFAASIFYGIATWPYHEDDNEENIAYHAKKAECYDKYIAYAPHPIERVEIPFESRSLPAILHLPREAQRPLPSVLAIRGMDALKEYSVPVYGDRFLERGIAVLALDGPGQGECLLRGIRCSADNYARAGGAAMDYLERRPEIDASRIALSGRSMGSFWGAQVAAHDHRIKAASVQAVCHEPGMNNLFNTASPTFKARYIWMASFENEDEFDEFARTLTLEGVGGRIKCPFQIVAGEDDELSPIKHSYDLYDEITAPKQIVVYRGERHSLSGALGWQTLVADWIKDRLDGKPMQSGRIHVDAGGAK
ncbi:MAG: alpha/beta hydrolase [Betaproteobacteria bacterium]|nr:alpha/beta hydrolase [Betaproteobacteria bacterium]